MLYSAALLHTRREEFYTDMGVPDTFDGRFDLLLLHIFLILHNRMQDENYAAISQALFDQTFKDMDQVLRERGIGDMGIPKHMRRMMKAFNGRMHAYQLAIDPDSLRGVELEENIVPASLRDTLKRNIYGTLPDIEEEKLQKMVMFVEKNAGKMKTDSDGRPEFLHVQ